MGFNEKLTSVIRENMMRENARTVPYRCENDIGALSI